MINGIHHIALVVRDLEKMHRFYTDGVGFEEVTRFEWEPDNPLAEPILGLAGSAGRLIVLRAGNAYLELHRYLQPDGTPIGPDNRPCDQGIRHFCLDVTDIDAVYERLLAAGMTFPGPPRRVDGVPVCTIYGRDPEGNIVEVQEMLSAGSFALSDLEKLRPGAFTP